jgi:hypothetical protein
MTDKTIPPFGYVVRHPEDNPGGDFYTQPILTEADHAAGWTATPVYAAETIIALASLVKRLAERETIDEMLGKPDGVTILTIDGKLSAMRERREQHDQLIHDARTTLTSTMKAADHED